MGINETERGEVMKECSRCLIGKADDGFYKHSRYADGYQGVCKECQRSRSRSLEPFKGGVYKKYRSSDKGMATRNKNQRDYAKRHPEKCKAHSMVNRAIAAGSLTRDVCEVCGDKNPHAHHDDYSKPLEVRWLCKTHHNEHHQQQILVGG